MGDGYGPIRENLRVRQVEEDEIEQIIGFVQQISQGVTAIPVALLQPEPAIDFIASRHPALEGTYDD